MDRSGRLAGISPGKIIKLYLIFMKIPSKGKIDIHDSRFNSLKYKQYNILQNVNGAFKNNKNRLKTFF